MIAIENAGFVIGSLVVLVGYDQQGHAIITRRVGVKLVITRHHAGM